MSESRTAVEAELVKICFLLDKGKQASLLELVSNAGVGGDVNIICLNYNENS